MSLSVITLHTLFSASTTGRNPQLPFDINSAAIPRFAWSDTQYGVLIITSFTFIAPPFTKFLSLWHTHSRLCPDPPSPNQPAAKRSSISP